MGDNGFVQAVCGGGNPRVHASLVCDVQGNLGVIETLAGELECDVVAFRVQCGGHDELLSEGQQARTGLQGRQVDVASRGGLALDDPDLPHVGSPPAERCGGSG
jgi:hypothetical protein